MKTGTDLSIPECRSSGYPVVEHGKSPMDPAKDYRLTISNPNAWTDSGQVKFGKGHKAYHFDGFISYKNLWELFESRGEGIKSFCDFKNYPYPAPDESPSFHDFVSLASTVDTYCGIG